MLRIIQMGAVADLPIATPGAERTECYALVVGSRAEVAGLTLGPVLSIEVEPSDDEIDFAMLDNDATPPADRLEVLRLLQAHGEQPAAGLAMVSTSSVTAIAHTLRALEREGRVSRRSVPRTRWAITPVGRADLVAAEREGGTDR